MRPGVVAYLLCQCETQTAEEIELPWDEDILQRHLCSPSGYQTIARLKKLEFPLKSHASHGEAWDCGVSQQGKLGQIYFYQLVRPWCKRDWN